MRSLSHLVTLAVSMWALSFRPPVVNADGSAVQFYVDECPQARGIATRVVLDAIRDDTGLTAALLRLNFHDCFVRGCDASVLLNSDASNVAEKDGVGNAFSLRGFEVIDSVKEEVEAVCPGIVSCADIIALAARVAVASIGGPQWGVKSGRKDGLISHGSEVLQNLPSPFADYSVIAQMFAIKGLNEKDMVVLSGSHTIGITHCGVIQNRLYNGTGPDGVDPTLDSTYAAELKQQCRFNLDAGKLIPLDPTKTNTFDSNYFTNVQQNKGLMESDATLITTVNGRAFVAEEASSSHNPFFKDFAASMEKMINIGILTGSEGEIRTDCRFIN